jgi:hypothetical protein
VAVSHDDSSGSRGASECGDGAPKGGVSETGMGRDSREWSNIGISFSESVENQLP